MSAELIVIWAPAPASEEELEEWRTWATGQTLTDEQLDQAVEHAFGAEFFDVFGEGDADDPDETKARDKLRERIRGAVRDLNDNREIAWYAQGINGGGPVFLAGGMSWGDLPEGADDLGLIYGAGLLDRFVR